MHPPTDFQPSPTADVQTCPHCQVLIDITDHQPLEAVACPACHANLQVSGQFDQFQLVSEAGRGGMGVVYRAYDPSLDRLVAIKLLRADHSNDARLVAQLETEAALTASVTDPHVVRVFSTGRDRGRFYIAMELVDTGSLEELIRRQGRVSEAQVLEVGIQIARGLRAAQQHGLIHRDVKPGNILFADAQTAKIVDFGLAIFIKDEGSARGEIWGTPYYVAPEKLDEQPEDFRSDMYSLGATLFHALAGRPPFEAESASLIALKHLKSQPMSLQAFAPWVSNATAHIINRTLHKNPDERYASYDDLIANLEYALTELRAAGHAPHERNRVVLETEADRQRSAWIVVGMLAAMAMLFAGFFAVRTKVNTDLAAATKPPRAEKPASAPRFQALAPELDALASADPKASELLHTAANDSKRPPTDRAWAQLLEGAALLSAGRPAAARQAFERVEPLAVRMKDENLARFLRSTAASLARNEPLGLADTREFKRHTHEALALLLYGLHSWQHGRIEQGTALLREFRSSAPGGSASWVAGLKPLATNFLEQATTFQMESARLTSATRPAERHAAAKALRALNPPLAQRAEAAIAPYAREIAAHEATLSQPPAAGVYRVLNRRSGKGLDVTTHSAANQAKVQQSGVGEHTNQQWHILPAADGRYKLLASHSLKALEASGNGPGGGEARIVQQQDNGAPAQRWHIEPAGAGWFRLRAVATGRCLTVRDGALTDGAALHLAADVDSDAQLWRFDPVGTLMHDGWVSSDLGTVPVPGRAQFTGDTFTITSQSTDLWGTADSCHFVHRSISGDFEFVARVTEIKGQHEWVKAALCARASLTPGARNVTALLSARMGLAHQRRLSGGQATTAEKLPGTSAPAWLKLVREGKRITSYFSTDGNDWKQLGADELDGPGGFVAVGLALTSHDPTRPATARFDQVKLTPRTAASIARVP